MKKVLSVILIIVLMLSILPMGAITAFASSSYTLDIDWDDIKGVGHQTPYTSACACFAVAYCRTILDGDIHSWSEYDLNSGSKGQSGAVAQWSKGKYATSAKSTVSATLKAVYDQINKGRPGILHVKGGRSTGQHWVAVVGYENVSDVNNLSYNNFLIIDSVASKYTLENLGTLGYTLKNTSGTGYRYAYTSTGSAEGTGNTTTVDPSITASKSSISLGTINNTSTTITVTCAGNGAYLGWTGSSSVYSVSKTSQNGNSITFKVSAKAAGTDTLGFSLYDSNNNVIASKNISVSVTAPTLKSSTSSVSLSLSGTNTNTVTLTAGGDLPSNYYFNANYPSSIIGLSITQSGEKATMTMTGKASGSVTITCDLINSSNNSVIATVKVAVAVSAPTYTVTYNANGGSNAPSSQTKVYNQDLTLSSSKPTGKTYTVTFNGNGGTVATSSQKYTQSFMGWNTNSSGTGTTFKPGGIYTGNSSLSLYAKWDNPTLSVTDPTRTGYYFLGWYDSTAVDEWGLPIGVKYTFISQITQNITLYAMWSTSPTVMYGDYNLDGAWTMNDIIKYNAVRINGSDDDEVLFRGDLDADGNVDFDDIELINQVRNNEISYTNLPAYQKFEGFYILYYPKTTYEYGESFDASGLSAYIYYTTGTYYFFENNLVVSGYDPYKIGTQTLTLNYYQYSDTFTVTVKAPQYSLYYNANGGTVSSNGKTVTYGSTIGALPTPTRAGYTFLGWSYSQSGTTYVTSSTTFSYMSNKTLYAQWSQNKYTVTYSANGGSNAPTSQTTTYGSTVTVPTSTLPQKTGYTFLGYSTVSNATTPAYVPGDTIAITQSMTLYSVWQKAIALDLEQLSVGEIVFKNQANIFSFTPDEDGYYKLYGENSVDITVDFPYGTSGSTKATGTEFSTSYVLLESGVTYYAKVTATNSNTTGTYVIGIEKQLIQHSVTLNNRFDYDITEILIEEGQTYTLPNVEESGFIFLGWATSSTATTATYQPDDRITIESDVYLYAVWKELPTSMSVNSSNSAVISTGGEIKYFTYTPTASGTYVIYSTGSDDTKVYLYNASGTELDSDDDDGDSTNFRLEYNLTAGTKYTFGIRYYNSSKTGTISFKFGNVYTIAYNANGGSGAPLSQKKDYGTDIALSSTQPTRTGYTFLGWSTSSTAASATYQAGGSFTSNANTTLYAIWSYTDTTNPTASISSTNDIESNQTVTLTMTDNIGVVSYYWGTSSNPEDSSFTTITSTISKTVEKTVSDSGTYYLIVWDKAGNKESTSVTLYKTTLDANGGSVIPTSVLTKSGNTISLPTPTRSGYDFLGWSTSSTATSATYQPGSDYISNANTTLYAVWKANTTYTVSYNANGGSGAPSNQAKTHGVSLTLSSTVPTRTGYTFLGWATNSTATSATYQPGGSFTSNANMTLYAVWKANTYTISYNANGGSGTMSNSIHTYDVSKALSSNVYTRSGYTFLGWSTSGSATTATYTNGQSVKNLTPTNGATVILYAVWEKEVVLSSISVENNPTKLIYYIGDNFSSAGLVVKLNYSDSSSGTITNGFTTSGFSSTSVGMKTVTVSFRGFSDTFTVTVKTPIITLSSSSKLMSVGDSSTITATTTPNGQTIIWTSSDTSVATVSNGVVTAKGVGTATITAKFIYNGIEYSRECEVTVSMPILKDIQIYTLPNKTVFYQGDGFECKGLQLLLTYNNGETEIVSHGFVTNHDEIAGYGALGTLPVTVFYGDLSVSYDIEIKATEAIISEENLSLKVGETATLTVEYHPIDSEILCNMQWKSSDSSVVKVDGGILTAVGVGTAKIWFSFANGSFGTASNYCIVTVTPNTLASGSCGDNADWELLSDGTLKITGSGTTKNYGTQQSVPWYSYASQIKRIEIAETITKIGHYSFYCLTNLESVTTDNANLNFGYYVFSGKTTFYAKGAGALEDFVKTEGHTLIKPENPEIVLNPELIETTMNSITLKALDGYEYSMDGIDWQDSNVFTGLFADTEYVFYQRIKEGVYKVSATSEEVRFSTLGQIAKPTIEKIENNTVTLTAKDGYEYSIDGSTWQTSNVFTDLDFDKILTFYQRIAGDTENISEAAGCLIPSAPVIQLVGATKIVVKAIDRYEYSLDGEYWQSSNVFTMLVPEFDYVVYQRYSGSDVYTVTSAETAFITNGQDEVDTAPDSSNLVTLRKALLNNSNDMSLDYNADGEINIIDLVRLKKFLVGIDVPLGKTETTETQTVELLSQPAYLEQKKIVA